ncbi:hypothetical protein GG681_08430 [Epibacterium sp. SM1969]|uniref:Uncharacterized protein n=1 Tax=Tritonibacter aquimaris TaxID=2663379 RepID=A0A844ATK4_9RHOB|nr:hypothetical protein [Tritonibacter aquimaris]MQY42668.1 hypothetical protein [Tritonibacter aquimaris]
MKTAVVSAVLLAALLPSQLVADEFRARNHMRVAPLSDTLIEVGGFTGNSGLVDYWCAVGDYLRRVRREPWQNKVYVARGLGAAQKVYSRETVLFSLDPAADGVEALPAGTKIVSTLTVGRYQRVNSAFYSCRTFRPRD